MILTTNPTRLHLLQEASNRRERVRACVDAWRTCGDEQQQRIAYGNINIALEAYAFTLDALGPWRSTEVPHGE